jgi:hypothetical protein
MDAPAPIGRRGHPGQHPLAGKPNGDSADRFLIAAARFHDLVLATADPKIVPHEALGHLKVLAP